MVGEYGVASEIEIALYGEEWAAVVAPDGAVGDHDIHEFSLAVDHLRLRVAAWEWRHSRWSVALFPQARLVSMVSGKPDDEDYFHLPWSIHTFLCERLEDGRWYFILNCENSRWRWTSDWPSIEHIRA